MLRTFRDRRVGQVDLELAPSACCSSSRSAIRPGWVSGTAPSSPRRGALTGHWPTPPPCSATPTTPHLCHETRRLAGRTPAQLLGRDVDAPDADQMT
jgi:hypothetical protein